MKSADGYTKKKKKKKKGYYCCCLNQQKSWMMMENVIKVYFIFSFFGPKKKDVENQSFSKRKYYVNQLYMLEHDNLIEKKKKEKNKNKCMVLTDPMKIDLLYHQDVCQVLFSLYFFFSLLFFFV